MSSVENYQDLLEKLIEKDPKNAALQRLMLVAADLPGSPKTRVAAIEVLVNSARLDRGVLLDLASDKSPVVRALAYDHGQRWTAAEITHMVATEKVASVRMKALEHPGLTDEVYTAACTPIKSRTAASNILAYVYGGMLPNSLLITALRRLFECDPYDLTTTDGERIEKAFEVPGIAGAIAGSLGLPYWASMMVAMNAAEVDEDTVYGMFATHMVNDDTTANPEHTAGPFSTHGLSEKLLEARPDLSFNALATLYRFLEPVAKSESVGNAARLAYYDAPERGLRRWNGSSTSTADQIREAWNKIPAEERGPDLAWRVVAEEDCPFDVLEEVSNHIEGDVEAQLLDFAARVTGGKPPRWMSTVCPDIALVALQATSLRQLGSAVRNLDNGDDGFSSFVARHMLTHPELWPEGALDSISTNNILDADLYRAVSAKALLAASLYSTVVTDEIVAQLTRIDTGDAAATLMLTQALVPMLDTDQAPLGDMVSALELAMSRPATIPVTAQS